MSSSSEHLQPTITVGKDDFRTALKHGMELFWSDSTPKKRLDQRGGRSGFSRYCNARVEGKLAEVAFSRFLEHQFGVESEIDWRIYGDYDETDHGDVRCLFTDDGEEVPPACEFDVKKTKSWNSWLAIRRGMYEQHPDDAPIVLCTMDLSDDLDVSEYEPWDEWPIEDYKFQSQIESYEDEQFPLNVVIEGAVYKDEFTHQFDEGDRLFDPDNPDRYFNATMRMNNEAIPVDDIPATRDRWNRVVEDIVNGHDIAWQSL